MSVVYACPTATAGHSSRSKTLIHTMPHKLSAICQVQLKLRFTCEENTPLECQTPLRLVTIQNCLSGHYGEGMQIT